MTRPNDPINVEQSPTTQSGLTKRELFAAMAMQGLCSNPNCDNTVQLDAELAVDQADALIAALNRIPPKMNPSSTDAFITWANRIIDSPNPSLELQLQHQRFNKETWRSLRQQLFIYSSTQRKDFFHPRIASIPHHPMTLTFSISFTCEVDPEDYLLSVDDTDEPKLRAALINEIKEELKDIDYLTDYIERLSTPPTIQIQ
jgi:hypothetical protein